MNSARTAAPLQGITPFGDSGKIIRNGRRSMLQVPGRKGGGEHDA